MASKFQSLIGIQYSCNGRGSEPLIYLIFQVHLRESTSSYHQSPQTCQQTSNLNQAKPSLTKDFRICADRFETQKLSNLDPINSSEEKMPCPVFTPTPPRKYPLTQIAGQPLLYPAHNQPQNR